MHIVKVPNTLKNKDYFWYLYRSLKILSEQGNIKLEYIDPIFFDEPFFICILVDDYPIFIDVRDNNSIDKDLDKYTEDYILLKSNYSTELMNNPPNNFEYPFTDLDRRILEKAKPFMHGRSFSMATTNEYENTDVDSEILYTISSITGKGVHYNATVSRLKIYDMLKDTLKNKANLVWIDKKHSVQHKDVPNYNDYLNKYNNIIRLPSYKSYIKFLKEAKFNLNISGICYSTPFRIVDSVLAERAIISTKIWHDLYKTFPCIELPICGHSGEGDWEKAKKDLTNLDNYDTIDIVNRAKDWYSLYFSAEGLFNNQIIRSLK